VTIFRAVFDTRTMRTGIHAQHCTAAQPTRGKHMRGTHSTTWTIEAANAAEAATQSHADSDGAQRGLPFPHICKCTDRR
jgi:hypothetical protein